MWKIERLSKSQSNYGASSRKRLSGSFLFLFITLKVTLLLVIVPLLDGQAKLFNTRPYQFQRSSREVENSYDYYRGGRLKASSIDFQAPCPRQNASISYVICTEYRKVVAIRFNWCFTIVFPSYPLTPAVSKDVAFYVVRVLLASTYAR